MKKESFNSGWLFFKEGSDIIEEVTLPHDAMLYEPRRAGNASSGACANFDGGVYHYVKHFVAPMQWAAEHHELYYEGIYRNAVVELNGHRIGGCNYGYSSFSADMDKYLLPGAENRLDVIADNSEMPNSRWYTGSGIYRPVWLLSGPEVFIKHQGLQISTISYDPPVIHVDVSHSGGNIQLTVEKDGAVLAKAEGDCCDILLPGAELWSDDSPVLYTCKARLFENGQLADESSEIFGIRKIEWSSKGLFINGRETLLRGGCVHADNGVLGAVSCREAEWRRVRLLKELGFNAIRSSHGPAAEEMLNACDFYGLYVMDETWDMWFSHKNRYDYASDFEAGWSFDLESMVKKDFNHPSVLMYSIGNEISEPASAKGMQTAHRIIDTLHALDKTRPVTGGINLMILVRAVSGKGVYKDDGSGADTGSQINSSMMFNIMTSMVGSSMNKAANSSKADAITSPILDALDIAGYNYASGRYPKEGSLHPDRLIFGSETFIPDLPKNWEMVKKYPWVIGDFMWTAWDYLGEAGAGAWAYTKDGLGFEKPYPWLLADMGVLDILGHPNGEAFLTAAIWNTLSGPRLAVRPLNKVGRPAKSSWRGTNSIPSWSWENCGGLTAVVEVYSSAYAVELQLNGRTCGKKRLKNCKASFKLKYVPGELKATAFDSSGHAIGTDVLSSATGKLSLRLTPVKAAARPGEIVYIDVETVGENGAVESNHDRNIRVELDGGELLGFGSADPRTEGSFVSGEYSSYYGQAQAIVRAGENGEITLRASAEGMTGSCQIKIEKD